MGADIYLYCKKCNESVPLGKVGQNTVSERGKLGEFLLKHLDEFFLYSDELEKNVLVVETFRLNELEREYEDRNQ